MTTGGGAPHGRRPDAGAGHGQRRDLPLSGVRVLDLSRLLPGGYATMLLADLGADVVKVEEPGRGDYMRWMPPLTSTGGSAAHLALGRGKRSVSVNLRTDEGREVLSDLAAGADVLIESFRPGVLGRLGVGYDALSGRNPGLVYAAISGYGQKGPYAQTAGHDINYLAYAGALSVSGDPKTGPRQPGLQIGDMAGGMAAVIAVLSALRVREETGRGQFCDVSMTDVVLPWLTTQLAGLATNASVPGLGTEALNGGLACYRVYECAGDGHVAVGALEPRFFAELLDGLGLPEELNSAHLDPDRQDELAARIATTFTGRTRDRWMEIFGGRDACVAPVNDMREAVEDGRARGTVADGWFPGGESFPRTGVVPHLAGTPGEVGGHPSPLGADTDALLAETGRTVEEVTALRDAGAI